MMSIRLLYLQSIEIFRVVLVQCKLYLASPLTVMASAFTGKISAWDPGLFD